MKNSSKISNTPKKHILITGASGAIGRYCVAEARLRGLQVSGLGHGQWETEASEDTIDFWATGDINIPSLMHVVERAGKIDQIIHLAGGSHVGRSFDNPAEDFQRTVVSAQQLLEWARLHAPDVAILFVSTAAVYGDQHQGLITEQSLKIPTSPYGAHKLIMEQLVTSYNRNFGIKAAIIRPFSVYGPGLRKQMIWELSKRLKATNSAPMLGGDGTETRDWVYMADAASMLLNAVNQITDQLFIVNLCVGKAITIADIAGQLCTLWDRPIPEFSKKHREGDPKHLVGDPTVTHSMGLVTKTPLDQGLKITVDWIKRELRNDI